MFWECFQILLNKYLTETFSWLILGFCYIGHSPWVEHYHCKSHNIFKLHINVSNYVYCM